MTFQAVEVYTFSTSLLPPFILYTYPLTTEADVLALISQLPPSYLLLGDIIAHRMVWICTDDKKVCFIDLKYCS
jgi:hypothetical protein